MNTMNTADARQARREEQQAKLDAHVKKIVDAWPPLTEEQRYYIAELLRPKRDRGAPLPPSPAEVERRRKEAEEARRRAEAEALAKKAGEVAIACAVCGIPPVAHYAQRAYGDFHEWVPRTADEIQTALAVLFKEKQA